MKKLLLSYMLLSSIAVGVANAGEKIFDLQDQYFSETMQKNEEAKIGHYDLPKVVVDTNAWYSASTKHYVSRSNGSAFMSVSTKKPLTNWVYIETKICDVYGRRQIDAVTRLTSDNGSSFFVAINNEKIVVNGKSFDVGIKENNTAYTIKVEKKADLLIATINGSVFLKTTIKDFGNLIKAETLMPRWRNDGPEDELISLEIYSK